MESILKNIYRPIWFNGKPIDDVESWMQTIQDGQLVDVVIPAESKKVQPATPKGQYVSGQSLRTGLSYIIEVKGYMTNPATPEFDFMQKWNSNNPMPLRVMQGRVLKETRGMVYMDLCGVPVQTNRCMKCGKPLTHPVSLLYGLGPECGGHFHINPFNTEEELYAALNEVKQKLRNVRWTGWIIKSAIECAKETK